MKLEAVVCMQEILEFVMSLSDAYLDERPESDDLPFGLVAEVVSLGEKAALAYNCLNSEDWRC